MDTLLYVYLIARVRVRVFSHDFWRGELGKKYPLDQKQTDLASRLTSGPWNSGWVIWCLGTWASLSKERNLCTACPCLLGHDRVGLGLQNETSPTEMPGRCWGWQLRHGHLGDQCKRTGWGWFLHSREKLGRRYVNTSECGRNKGSETVILVYPSPTITPLMQNVPQLCEQRCSLWTSCANSVTIFLSQKFTVYISWKVSQFRNLLSVLYPGFPKLCFYYGVFFSSNPHQSQFQRTHFWKCHFNVTLKCTGLKCS